jgi:DNA-binding NtrC family response regulator
MPSLRERQEDVPLLVEHFLRALSSGGAAPAITREALRDLTDYPWPGNVRELRNAIEYALVMAQGRPITPSDLPADIRQRHPRRLWTPEDTAERERVRAALAAAGGNRTRAAAALGTSRVTLWKKLRRYEAMADEASPPAAFEVSDHS